MVWRISKRHHASIVAGKDGTFSRLVERIGFWCCGSQSIKRRLGTSWNKLGVSEAFVIATVAQELGEILQCKGEIFIRDASFLLERFPVSVGGFVQLDDEIEDILGLW